MTPDTLHNLHTIDIEPGEIGVTVRRGMKWSGAKPGDEIKLCVCVLGNAEAQSFGEAERGDTQVHSIVGRGIVTYARLTYMLGIRAWELDHEHSASARTYRGLMDGMRRAYGPDFDEWEDVIVLHYRRVE
jgi:hypothetical protein